MSAAATSFSSLALASKLQSEPCGQKAVTRAGGVRQKPTKPTMLGWIREESSRASCRGGQAGGGGGGEGA